MVSLWLSIKRSSQGLEKRIYNKTRGSGESRTGDLDVKNFGLLVESALQSTIKHPTSLLTANYLSPQPHSYMMLGPCILYSDRSPNSRSH